MILSTRCSKFYEICHGKENETCFIGEIEKLNKWRGWCDLLFEDCEKFLTNASENSNNSNRIAIKEETHVQQGKIHSDEEVLMQTCCNEKTKNQNQEIEETRLFDLTIDGVKHVKKAIAFCMHFLKIYKNKHILDNNNSESAASNLKN